MAFLKTMDMMAGLFVLVLLPLFTFGSSIPHKQAQITGRILQFERVGPQRSIAGMQRYRRSAQDKPTIDSLRVISKVSSRFAQVEYNSILSNDKDTDLEAVFTVYIPETAFISNFTMVIDGEFYVAEVAAKEDVDKRYEEAKQKNQTAAKVQSQSTPPVQLKNKEVFTISVNVAAQSTVTFNLYYMELLVRRLGLYTHSLSIRPRQIVNDLLVEVKIFEPQGFSFFQASDPYFGGSSTELETSVITDQIRYVKFAPGIEHQQLVANPLNLGGDLEVVYDINHYADDAGLVQVDNGYFIHYFSPEGLPVINKNVVFIVDRSGSMGGRKMDQTREAMTTIVQQLTSGDFFQMVFFDNDLYVWPPSVDGLAKASAENIRKALAYIDDFLKASGGTDINQGLLYGCQEITKSQMSRPKIVVFLTDGAPTAGITSTDMIVKNVMESCGGQASVFSIGFGFNLNYELISAVSYATGGYPRRIHEDEDASDELKNFFKEVSRPLMFDVEMQYPDNVIELSSTTNRVFPQYFQGTELIVAGKLNPSSALQSWTVKVVGQTTTNVILEEGVTGLEIPDAASDIYTSGFAEKMYVYMKIKELLRKKLATLNDTEKMEYHKKALELALEYHLVTPITSMIITQEEERPSFDEADFSVAGNSVLFSSKYMPKANMSGVEGLRAMTVYILGFIMFVLVASRGSFY